MTQDLVKRIVLGLLRLTLAGVSVWAHNRRLVSPDEWEFLLLELASALVAIGGSVLNKIRQVLSKKYALELSPEVPAEVAHKIIKQRVNETIKASLIGGGK
jgi:hypothetical protein